MGMRRVQQRLGMKNDEAQKERMRQHMIDELNAMGIRETAKGVALHNCDYQEIKYFYSVKRAVMD